MSQELQTVKQRFGIVGNSPQLNNALEVAMRVAPTGLSVLITGESGVGKEIFSQIIHAYSPRKHEPFIAVNCGAIPEGTIDSELFGHEKGAFTGAQEKRKGYFETVNGGSIFLDEIGEMPLPTQSRLLRVLESGEIIKVGSSQVQKTDVRVIAATNVQLMEAVQKGKFREDLFYRLSTVPIEIPPLRERGEDIVLLFRKFMVDFAERSRMSPPKLDDSARDLLRGFAWPGNVRQLKNTAEQLCVLSNKDLVGSEDLRALIPELGRSSLPALHAGSGGGQGDGFERELIYKMLFEIKNDLAAMKKFLLKLGQQGFAAEGPDMHESNGGFPELPALPESSPVSTRPVEAAGDAYTATVIVDHDRIQDSETIEESLSIADKERELIIKALKKHRSKRKDAASDLGISERTLYRKIKEYDIQE